MEEEKIKVIVIVSLLIFAISIIMYVGSGDVNKEDLEPYYKNGSNIRVNNVRIDGNLSAKRPYAMFSSMDIQNITSTAIAFPIHHDITEDNYLINISADGHNITIQQSGDYLISTSAIVDITGGANVYFHIWAQKNGVNIPRSNTRVQIANAGVEQIIAVTFIMDLMPGDRFQLMMAASSTAARLVSTGNSTSPDIPAAPGVITSITKISEIPSQ